MGRIGPKISLKACDQNTFCNHTELYQLIHQNIISFDVLEDSRLHSFALGLPTHDNDTFAAGE
jgi:hypothetical protein